MGEGTTSESTATEELESGFMHIPRQERYCVHQAVPELGDENWNLSRPAMVL